MRYIVSFQQFIFVSKMTLKSELFFFSLTAFVNILVTAQLASNYLPSLCLQCKCNVKEASTLEYVVECDDLSVTELARVDSWPSDVRLFSMTHAGLKEIPKLPQTKKLEHLSTLSLSYNNIDTIPDNVFQNFNLKIIDLSHNDLSQLNLSSLHGNEDLKILKLQNNNFISIDWKIFNTLQNLEELYLGNNFIKLLNGETNLQHLKVLDLSGNELDELPQGTCEGLPVIETLLLADNNLREIPSCVLNLRELRKLVLDANHFAQISDSAFYTLAQLRTLSLSRLLELTEVNGGALKGIFALENLTISHNPKLTSVPSTLLLGGSALQNFPNLITVDLSYNALTTIPQNLTLWDKFETFDLQGNPWDCSCKAQWMLDILIPKLYAKNSSQLVEVRCATPSQLSGRRLVHWLNRESKRGVWCEDNVRPAQQVALGHMSGDVADVSQAGSSHGMLIALAVCSIVAIFLMAVALLLQRRATAKKKAMATRMGLCRNPRNGHIRLTNPKIGI